jgi:mRNA-degrading endonuclease YafQ of YafQ-DinJ toxin-antitoxin module
MNVSLSKGFKRSFKKRIKGTIWEARFWQRLEVFTDDPFEPSLKTHKLSGNLKESWSFSLDYDQRVVFYFTADGNAVFTDIGTHDEVY